MKNFAIWLLMLSISLAGGFLTQKLVHEPWQIWTIGGFTGIFTMVVAMGLGGKR